MCIYLYLPYSEKILKQSLSRLQKCWANIQLSLLVLSNLSGLWPEKKINGVDNCTVQYCIQNTFNVITDRAGTVWKINVYFRVLMLMREKHCYKINTLV
jgi:hypothetical protein